jgi:hypothetical protein
MTLACAATPPAYNVLDFCTDAAQAMCQITNACSADLGTCQAYQFEQCKTKAIQATSPERRVYNADSAHFCIGALQAAYHDGTTSVAATQLALIKETCERVYVGLSGVGQFCETDYDCSAGLACASQTPGSNPTVCEPAQQVEQGQSCASLGSQCAAGTYCAKGSGGAWTCSSCPATGQPCGAPVGYCMSGDHCDHGTCQPRGGEGAPCVTSADCAADAAYCDPYSSTCATGQSFQRGSADCRGVSGLNPPPDPPPDAGASNGQDS